MKRQKTSINTNVRVIICADGDIAAPLPGYSAAFLKDEEANGFLRRICYREEPPGERKTEPIPPDALVCVDSSVLKKNFNENPGFLWDTALQVLSLRFSTVVFSKDPPDTEDVTALVNSSAEGWVTSSELPGYLEEIISAAK